MDRMMPQVCFVMYFNWQYTQSRLTKVLGMLLGGYILNVMQNSFLSCNEVAKQSLPVMFLTGHSFWFKQEK